MRNYELFIIEESVARHYFGQESKLFYLFVEYEKAKGSQKELIQKQIDYITKPIPVLLLQKKLKKAFMYTEGYKHVKNNHVIQLAGCDAKAELVIGPGSIYLTSFGDSSYEVESMFFEILRKCEPTFFAIAVDEHRYGWLRPVKQDVYLTPSHM
ncbi:sporulation inhibitor of replication protein SirA [bacterium LRH843]|nr:sporulation inhibitor of replication protein SirA [bacterium LRH843]